MKHAMKVVERIFEYRIRQQIEIDDGVCVGVCDYYYSNDLSIKSVKAFPTTFQLLVL